MYLLSDDYGDYKEIIDYKGLKNLLKEEVVRDTLENYQNYNIVRNNINILEKLIEKEFDLEYITKELLGFGFYVLDLTQLKININDLREYYARDNSDLNAFDKIIEIIDKGV